MQNKLFDDFVKQAVDNSATEVPKGLWEKVAQENKKRKPIPFWQHSNTGFVVVGVCIALALIFVTTNTPLAPLTIKENNLSTADIAAFEQKNNSNNTLNETVKSTNNNLPSNNIVGLNTVKNNTDLLPENTGLVLANNNATVYNSIHTLEKNTSVNNIDEATDLPFKSLDANTVAVKKTSIASVNNKEALLQPTINKNLIFGLGCPGETKYPWMIEAYASPDYTLRKFTPGGVSDFFLRRKDSTENLKMGFSVGVRVSKKITDNIVLKTGFQYAQINERVTLVTENERRTTTVITVRSVIRAPGDTIFVRDTSAVTQIGYLTRKIKNRYRNLEIPLLASYETNGDSWKLAGTIGAIVNISSWYSGFVLDTSNNLVPISHREQNGFYKNEVGVSFYASISAIKRITENMEIFTEPYMRIGLNNNATSEVGYNQRFSGIGINMGLRFTIPSKGNKTQ